MFVKLFKTILFSYIIRKGIKESDTYVFSEFQRETSFVFCNSCGTSLPKTILQLADLNPYCPVCNTYVSHQKDSYTNLTRNPFELFLEEFENIEYIY